MVDRRTMRKPPKIRVAPRSGFAKLDPVVAAVDAAKDAPAWAVAEGGELFACGFDRTPGGHSRFRLLPDIDTVALEVSPPRGAADGNPTHVFEMNVGGALCAGSMRAGRVVLVYPADWAGTASAGKGKAKPARHARVWDALTPRERELVAKHFKKSPGVVNHLRHYILAACDAAAVGGKVHYSDPVHNVLDVVGLLLFAVGRLGRGCSRVRQRSGSESVLERVAWLPLVAHPSRS